MDEKGFEMAEAITAALIANGVERVCSQVRQRDPDFDGFCTLCDNEIPPARVDTGAITCIDCQEILEHQERQYKR